MRPTPARTTRFNLASQYLSLGLNVAGGLLLTPLAAISQAAEATRQADALREQQALERQRQEAADRQVRDQQQQQAAKAVNASLQQAQNALNAGEYQSAIAVARVVLGMDPNNSRARNIIRQAEQQLKEALNRTRIE